MYRHRIHNAFLGLCRAGSRLYTFGVVPPCSAGPIATVAPAHRGWFVANSEVILFWRRGVWTNFPENGFEQLNPLGWRAKGTYRADA